MQSCEIFGRVGNNNVAALAFGVAALYLSLLLVCGNDDKLAPDLLFCNFGNGDLSQASALHVGEGDCFHYAKNASAGHFIIIYFNRLPAAQKGEELHEHKDEGNSACGGENPIKALREDLQQHDGDADQQESNCANKIEQQIFEIGAKFHPFHIDTTLPNSIIAQILRRVNYFSVIF